uniref:Uncharacterized protein AlNc14C191G8451 n=1 Tax=Albugo laibachii Nc14 TaxID=890382 RepID=F0WPW0_9STRA|nr:conserved hypothetical protein [Albugo laibachii Nc14]|eukprot:CCA23361.1 conserved hypothetical protein [Albugo laibachii Nc14]
MASTIESSIKLDDTVDKRPDVCKGTFVFPDGSRYEGEYIDEDQRICRHGRGKYTAGPESYEGEWEKDEMHGSGTYTFATGARYEGQFDHNEFSGNGSYYWPDGASYHGAWKHNRMDGSGAYKDKDGVEWSGQFVNGNDRGTVTVIRDLTRTSYHTYQIAIQTGSMPLVVICGLPGAGKTVIAKALLEWNAPRSTLKTRYITESSVSRNRLTAYRDANEEKITRSALRAAVETALNDETIVLLDAINDIKGVRYELFCKAKAESTTYCLLYVDVSLDVALEQNAAREDRFDADIIEAIAQRFEVPNERNRWDRPLFHIKPSRIDEKNCDALDSIPFESILNAIQNGNRVKAGSATKAPPRASMSFVPELDRVTLEIIDLILASQQDGQVVGKIHLPNASESVDLNRIVPAAELRRHRLQFLSIQKAHPCTTPELMTRFVEFLRQQTK